MSWPCCSKQAPGFDSIGPQLTLRWLGAGGVLDRADGRAPRWSARASLESHHFRRHRDACAGLNEQHRNQNIDECCVGAVLCSQNAGHAEQ